MNNNCTRKNASVKGEAIGGEDGADKGRMGGGTLGGRGTYKEARNQVVLKLNQLPQAEMMHRRVLSRANWCYGQLRWPQLSHHSQSPNYMQILTINCLVHTPFKQRKSVKRESPHALPQFTCTPNPPLFF